MLHGVRPLILLALAVLAAAADPVPASAPASVPPPGARPPRSDEAAWLDRLAALPRLGHNLLRADTVARPVGDDYRLQAGDALRVVAWGGPTLSEAVPVDPSGSLALPGIGAVPVAGLTVAEARERVQVLVRGQWRNAGLVLAVEKTGPTGIVVTGEVANPGIIPIPAGGTVLDALGAAGGTLPAGSLRTVSVRPRGGAPVVVDLYRVALDGELGELAQLAPGTGVHVPLAGPVVQVFGAVRRPAAVELRPGESLAEALRLAGGQDPAADPDGIRLLREEPDGQRLVGLDLAGLARVPARDGDRLLVALRRSLAGGAATVRIEGAVRTPGAHPWREGLTLGQAIALAGGLVPGGDPTRAVVERWLDAPRQVDLGNGLVVPAYQDLLANPGLDLPLGARDTVRIPLAPTLAGQPARVTVEGAVNQPGPVPYTPAMRVRDAVVLAGGLRADAQVESADLVRVRIEPDGTRNVERTALDLRPVVAGEPGPALQALDTVVVRTRADDRVRITITGEVQNSGTFVLPRGATLRQAVEAAGGLTPDAFPEGARFYRESEVAEGNRFLQELARRTEQAIIVNQNQLASARTAQGQLALQSTIANQQNELVRLQQATATGRLAGIDLVAIVAGRAEADIALRPGDRVEIPSRPGTIRVLGEVMVPGSVRFERGLRPLDVVRRSGGPTSQADEDHIFVVRADGTVVASAAFTTTAWDRDSRRWVRNDLRKVELLEGDAVIVPADLTWSRDGIELAKDLSQILFQVAGVAGTIAVLSR